MDVDFYCFCSCLCSTFYKTAEESIYRLPSFAHIVSWQSKILDFVCMAKTTTGSYLCFSCKGCHIADLLRAQCVYD